MYIAIFSVIHNFDIGSRYGTGYSFFITFKSYIFNNVMIVFNYEDWSVVKWILLQNDVLW